MATGNIRESALRAGFKKCPFKLGSELLFRKDINLEIEKLYEQKKKTMLYKALSGYERLAFGNVVDAIKLLYFTTADIEEISNMDLFNISEIKRLKDGAVEIKFFDRVRALEKIQSMDFASTDQSLSFYSAIKKGTDSFESHLED